MFLQQMSTLPWGFTGIGIQYLMMFAVSLAAGMVFTLIRDFKQHGRTAPASCKATIRSTQDR